MEKKMFAKLFRKAVLRASDMFVESAEGSFIKPTMFLVHAPSAPTEPVDESTAISLIFLNEHKFYKIIDIGVMTRGQGEHVGFVAVSGHHPGEFSGTFNPADLGPFKALAPFDLSMQRPELDT